jgi:hypothetical protein
MGGPNTPENLVEVTVTQHAMFHFCNYQLWGNGEDFIAWRGLSGQITMDEAKLEAQVLNSKRNGQKSYENKTGIFSLTDEQRKENGKKSIEKQRKLGIGFFGITTEKRREVGKRSGQKSYESKTGIFSLTRKERVEIGRRSGQKSYENKTGFFSLTKDQRIKNNRKAGKIGGKKAAEKNKENGTAVYGLSFEQRSEAGKLGSKNTNSQKWQCTVTGYVTNAGALTIYQRKRGIDPSNRTRIE